MWLDERNDERIEQTSILRLFIPEQRSSWGLPQCCLDTACPHQTGSRSHSTWPACAIIHSRTHLFVLLLICSITCSCICSFAHGCIQSSMRSFMCSCIHLFIHSFIRSSIHPSIHPFMQPFVHASIHSFSHPCIHSVILSVHALTAMTQLVVLGCCLTF